MEKIKGCVVDSGVGGCAEVGREGKKGGVVWGLRW